MTRVNKLTSVLPVFLNACVRSRWATQSDESPGRALKWKSRRIGTFVFLTAERRAELEMRCLINLPDS